MTGCKLAEEMASGCPGKQFGEEGMCPNEGGTLDVGVSARKSHELSSVGE